MNMREFVSGLVCALVVLWGSSAAAQTIPLTVTLGGSESIFDSEQEVSDEVLPFAAFELRFTERWASEIWVSSGETNGDNGFDVDATRWHLDALYYLVPDAKLHPYVAFGGGQLKRDWDVPNGNLDDTTVEANIGAGMHYFLTDNLSLRGDLRYLFGVDDSTSDFTLSLGVSYRFGAKAKPVAMAEPVVVAAAEPVRLDSDGDGVYDDMDQCPGTPTGTAVDSRGCERVAPAVSQVASVKLTVNFGFNSTEVEEHYFADLKGLAEFLKRFDDLQLDVEGHTDSVGSEEYNQDLSQRRADAVRHVLINSYGIAAARIEAKGFGESRPVASNDTAEGRAENRRVMATLEVEYAE